MARLTRVQTAAHNEAVELLKKDVLTDDDKEFVFNNWYESANHDNGAGGAFFTPLDMAWDFEIDVPGMKIIDLCAGIGVLAYAAVQRRKHNWDRRDLPFEMTCVEINPAYVEVGQKLVPEATWICGDATDPVLIASLGHFDCAMANPPFGNRVKSNHPALTYTGKKFEFRIIEIASRIADHGAFIIPQMSAPFQYSGQNCNTDCESASYMRFNTETGIVLDAGCGVDTAYHAGQWKSPVPLTEIVTVDFVECRADAEALKAPADLPAVVIIPPSNNAYQLALF